MLPSRSPAASGHPGQPEEWDAAGSALRSVGETAAGLERLHEDSANPMPQQRGMTVDDGSSKVLMEAMHRAYPGRSIPIM